MPTIKIEVDGFRCARCGHEWVPRKSETPRVCPKCKSPFWDRERRMAAFRAEARVEGRGWPPDRKTLQALERRLGAARRPAVRSSSTHARIAFDVSAVSEANAEGAARRLVNAAARALGLRGHGFEVRVRVTTLGKQAEGTAY